MHNLVYIEFPREGTMVVRASFSKLTAGNRIEQVGRQELFPAAFLFSAFIKKRKV